MLHFTDLMSHHLLHHTSQFISLSSHWFIHPLFLYFTHIFFVLWCITWYITLVITCFTLNISHFTQHRLLLFHTGHQWLFFLFIAAQTLSFLVLHSLTTLCNGPHSGWWFYLSIFVFHTQLHLTHGA